MDKKIKVVWNDILKYGPNVEKRVPTRMSTEGILVREDKKGLLIFQPKTINHRTKQRHPKDTPTYYFIPSGLVVTAQEE